MIDIDLFYEDVYKFNETTLFSDIDDCSYCPFREDGLDSEYCDHSGSPDISHPCEFSRSSYKDMSIQEVIASVISCRIAYEDYLDRKWHEEKLESEKKAIAKAKRAQTSWENRDLNNEIKRLNKLISAKLRLLSFVRSMSFADNMLNNKSVSFNKNKHPLELEVEELNKRIDNIKQVKKERAKERRKTK